MTEYVILVDENDNEIGSQEKISAHEQAQCHRAFSIFITHINDESDMEILLQKREPNKYHAGGLWTNTCCGHPRPGEATITAGERRLFEEMGITSTLKEISVFHYITRFDNGLTENEVDHVLTGELGDSGIQMNPVEATDYRWTTPANLQQDINEHPERFTPWLSQALEALLADSSQQTSLKSL